MDYGRRMLEILREGTFAVVTDLSDSNKVKDDKGIVVKYDVKTMGGGFKDSDGNDLYYTLKYLRNKNVTAALITMRVAFEGETDLAWDDLRELRNNIAHSVIVHLPIGDFTYLIEFAVILIANLSDGDVVYNNTILKNDTRRILKDCENKLVKLATKFLHHQKSKTDRIFQMWGISLDPFYGSHIDSMDHYVKLYLDVENANDGTNLVSTSLVSTQVTKNATSIKVPKCVNHRRCGGYLSDSPEDKLYRLTLGNKTKGFNVCADCTKKTSST
jgi:hypothetical protein